MTSSGDWIMVEQFEGHEDHSKPGHRSVGILADVLIPGRGKPAQNQAVVFDNGKIVYVGSRDAALKEYRDIDWQHVPVLMPGMWECHSHFCGTAPGQIDAKNMFMGNPVEAGARNVRALKEVLYAGFTSCVDLGGYAPELQKVMDEGLVLGPKLYGAGAAISMTAGHGEAFDLSYGTVRQKLSVNAPGADAGVSGVYLVDGVEECRKAVRLNLRRGAKIIKVFTSGGVASRDDDFSKQQFSDEELKVIVDEAGRMGLVCTAHAVGKAGIVAAIRAGFKVIQHNSYADDEVLEAIKAKNIMVVATVTPIRQLLANEDQIPPSTVKKLRAMYKTHLKAYQSAVKAGVKCATGSDLFGSVGSALSPGMNGKEVIHAVEAGMTALQAIEAATANGPDTLGPQAPQSGQIRVGYDADFLGLEHNPLDNIEILANPKEIKCIWKSGHLVKAPGLDPWAALDS